LESIGIGPAESKEHERIATGSGYIIAKLQYIWTELTQRQLARLVGTTASVICRLEDADYEGHYLAMLHRIAAALNRRVEIRFVRGKTGGVCVSKPAVLGTSRLRMKRTDDGIRGAR
jgi:hypothetical protein